MAALREVTDDCVISERKEGVDVCQPTGLCWERASPFTGGSVPWRGAAGGREVAEGAEGPCRWARCPWHSCPLYSCSGDFELRKFRPICREFTSCPDKSVKRRWCYPLEANILQHCAPCPRGRYECCGPEAEGACAARPPQLIPLFRWQHGIPYPNTRREPYPHLLEGLRWLEQPPAPPPPRRESDAWALGCWRCDGAPSPPCPGQWQRVAPLFTWRNGYAKENFSRAPYPGRGPRPFDACAARLRELQRRRPQPAAPKSGGPARAGCGPPAPA